MPHLHPFRFSFWLLLFVLLTPAALLTAQSAPVCPPSTLLSLARAGAACAAMSPGEACYGSGTVVSTPNGDAAGLVRLGDRAPLRSLSSIQAIPPEGDAAAVSIAALAIRTSPRAPDVITVLLVGAASLRSDVPPPVEVLLRATGVVHVRATPNTDSAVLVDLAVNNSVVANGRTSDSAWLRVTVPATGASGWVNTSLVSAAGNVGSLPVVSPGDVIAPPFGVVHFGSEEFTACDGSLHAGALLQTPSTRLQDAVALTLNDADLRLAGTAFLTQQDNTLALIVLDGAAQVGAQVIPAGASARLELDAAGAVVDVSSAAPYDAALIAALPVNNLPRRFTVVAPLAASAVDAAILAVQPPPPTAVIVPPTPVNACRRSVGRDTNLWSGPGEDYEALGALAAGTAITPVLATTNARGEVWWQLTTSGWIARSLVVERGDCTANSVPIVVRVAAPPTNTYSLERCQSNNGPVRAGQRVTFEFIPPAWDNLGEATAATRTDPGRFMLNARRYRATASAPFRLGATVDPLEDRYLRRFTFTWVAVPGSYRVTGDWLSYEPSCDLTVPVE